MSRDRAEPTPTPFECDDGCGARIAWIGVCESCAFDRALEFLGLPSLDARSVAARGARRASKSRVDEEDRR